MKSDAVGLVNRNTYDFYSTLLLLAIVGCLFAYKGQASLGVVAHVGATGAFQPRNDVVPIGPVLPQLDVLTRTLNYFAVVWPALLFGILISAAVRAYASPRWLVSRLESRSSRTQLVAGLAGVPLMLCSCCVAPIFTSVYERSSRLGPSLAIMFAAPSLNPAALVLTFMLFQPRLAVARLAMGIMLVFLGATVPGKLLAVPPGIPAAVWPPRPEKSLKELTHRFLYSLLHVAWRTVPALGVGVMLSMIGAEWLPMNLWVLPGAVFATIVIVASMAVPLALPTFFEIPLALTLLAAGAPNGAAAAVLFAGPAINLPSLFAMARATNWKVAATVACTVWLLAVLGGSLVGS